MPIVRKPLVAVMTPREIDAARAKLARFTGPEDPETGCWPCDAAFYRSRARERRGNGHRQITVRVAAGGTHDGSRRAGAHCLAFELANGPTPAGLLILHRCGRPECVNPAHLYAGTPKQNSDDKFTDGTAPVGSRSNLSKYDESVILAAIEALADPSRSAASVGREFGISRPHVWHLRAGRRYRHIPRPWLGGLSPLEAEAAARQEIPAA